MRKQTDVAIEAHIIRGAFYLFLLATGTVMAFFGPQAPTKVLPGTLSFAERVAYQRAIEDVYWRHRIWPKENPNPKPSLDAVISQAQLEKKVEDYLLNSQAVEDYYKEPLSAGQLQGEMDRMAQHTRQPEVLRKLFEALGNDPSVIAECLARPVLTERLIADVSAHDKTGHFESARSAELQMPKKVAAIDSIAKAVQVNRPYQLPMIASPLGGCNDDTWTATSTNSEPSVRFAHTAVWTGTEMIVWGGVIDGGVFDSGGRYDPATDSWTTTSTTNVPTARRDHRAVWTGSEMIVWGGCADGICTQALFSGGRYNPITNSWAATNSTNAPSARFGHAAVWTGSEMIVWGGQTGLDEFFNTGGRYDPGTDSWTSTNTTNAPTARSGHAAVWTGSEMIVWGGGANGSPLNTGGKYNRSTDTWIAMSTTNAPSARFGAPGVWTGNETIVWGGCTNNCLNTGGRYDPSADAWTATSITNAPVGRGAHTAVWTGSEMIVWGGTDNTTLLNTGGRYDPGTDSWTATSTTNAPSARRNHTAVWTDSEMVVWGWDTGGGRYCAAKAGPPPSPTPSPTANATPTSTATATASSTPPRPTPTPRFAPSPRLRPTPAPRP